MNEDSYKKGAEVFSTRIDEFINKHCGNKKLALDELRLLTHEIGIFCAEAASQITVDIMNEEVMGETKH